MIQLLATKYQKTIAFGMFFLFNLFSMFSAVAGINRAAGYAVNYERYTSPFPLPGGYRNHSTIKPKMVEQGMKQQQLSVNDITKTAATVRRPDIGGPSQPEMSSFKPADANNMVDLFTGDFNYNIPLLDVGGYPVNIFYDGNIGLEQEASWVGLGWNINPGLINRNMRGVPDDFNGTDELIESQNMKPNKTWGVNVAGDLELGGTKMINVGTGLGISFNNYLGLALERSIKGGVNFNVAQKVKAEKDAGDSSMLNLSVGLNVSRTVNSRNGVTYSAGVSLTASKFHNDRTSSMGIGATTSYNSRYGIKEVQLYDQMSFNKKTDQLRFSLENHLLKWETVQYSSTNSANLFSTTISFARPSYMPAMRMPLNNTAYSGHFQLGGAIFGTYGSVEAEVYKQTSEVSPSKVVQTKPLVGYLYYENAMNNPNAVMDFTRFNDQEVTSRTSIISVPQYTYDVFSIQGEGTGGTVRAYRNDLGYVRDNATGSQDKNISVGVDIGIPGHFGANFNQIKTPTTIGEWGNNNRLHSTIPFKGPATGGWQNVYFRNPGETSVLTANQYSRIGGTDLVRFKISGNGHPAVDPVLDRFSKNGYFLGSVNVLTSPQPSGRVKRTQVVSFLKAEDADKIGLDKKIKSYDGQTVLDNSDNTLKYTTIDRVSSYRKAHHISEIDITEGNGKRYIYGIPVYNVKQKDFTFTIQGTDLNSPETLDKVSYTENEASATGNPSINGVTGSRDGVVQITETPAYAHSFLLSGLLSPDYVDVTGNGITEDDLGNAVKFNYSCMKDGSGNPAVHRWRTPADKLKANYNYGKRTYFKDDAGLISYGERESWYLHSIESKTMIALFTLNDTRDDGKGVENENGGIDAGDNTVRALKEINLYSKADLKKNGVAGAKPIKTVHFVYATTNALCNQTPDNVSGGKLTLEKIYFTYNKQSRSSKDQYVFSYTNADGSGNPNYTFNATDRWGSYKPESMNPGGLKNRDYPYTIQDDAQKTVLNQQAAAWSLKRILLPSGGQIEVSYESDDYAFVQNKRAADMMTVVGFGNNQSAYSNNTHSNRLYEVTSSGIKENNYLFAHVPVSCNDAPEVLQKYLAGMEQIAVKLAVKMPNGLEYLTSYANFENYGVTADDNVIWIKLKEVDGLSPLSLTAIEYLREQLPGQATPGYDVSESSGLKQVGEALIGMLYAVATQFKDPVGALRTQGKAQKVQLDRCFIRLNDPDGVKYGGGQRVKALTLKDNWSQIGSAYTTSYMQVYDYATTENFNGQTRTISSGVASYEPTVGGDENPFQTIVQVADKLPLGPASYGAVELPVLDAFFPAPVVGYSKVTVHSIPSTKHATQQKSRSGIGRQVTEFYTSKDFPVYYANTNFDPNSDRQSHSASGMAFFYKYAFDSRALSQGFVVATNNMNGKLRSQTSYAENDTTLKVNHTEHFYRNTGVNGLNEQFDFVSAKDGGLVTPGAMGIDIELMTDTREFSVNSKSLEVQGQLDLFPVFFPIWLPFIWPVVGNSENHYRAVTTTKVINYHAILDSIVVYDKGSQASTKNLIYDAETGDLVVTRTHNEFELPIYSTSYPAWWAYSGMGPAYRNIDAVYSSDFYDGRISPSFDKSVLESGDELYVTTPTGTSGCIAASAGVLKLWVYDKNKDNTSLTVTTANKDLIFMDENGKLFTGNGVSFRIVRSGKRNMLDAKVASVMLMSSPVDATTGKLKISTANNVLTASAIEYKEKWHTDNDVFKKRTSIYNPSNCTTTEIDDCNGYWEKSINPYRKGLMGSFSVNRGMVFYGSRAETDFADKALYKKGFLSNFQLYWNFDANNNLVPDVSNTQWVWNSEVTRHNAKGMELETKDAMGIYTAAQYGYHKTLPLAITNNSRYDEMAYEGFEDFDYSEFLNKTDGINCGKKHFDITTGSQIVDEATAGFNAHTGKNMLKVNNGSSVTKQFPIQPVTSTYTMPLQPNSTKSFVLSDQGGNIDLVEMATPGAWAAPIYVADLTTDVNISAQVSQLNVSDYGLTIHHSQYFEVQANGQYSVGMQINHSVNFTSIYPDMAIILEKMDPQTGYGTQVFQQSWMGNNGQAYGVFLCKGVYKLISRHWIYDATTPTGGAIDFKYYVNGPYTLTYKTLSTVTGCTFTDPIAGTDAMQNPVFNVPGGKKMLFSAWVHEQQCNNCANNGFTNNQITLQYSATPVVLTPSGPVIDGWQRYTGEFTAPSNAISMTMRLANNSSDAIYFDDIRIHPWSANMKSYVYDPVNLRLTAELDANNYATFYEYDEEGTLIRKKVETEKGIKTVIENRSAKQKNLNSIQ